MQSRALKLIKDSFQYSQALEEVSKLAAMDPPTGSESAERLEHLAILIREYETERFALDHVDPIDALTFRMAQAGKSQKDLADLFQSAPRASEILKRKRPLTLEQIRILNREWGIPAEILISTPRNAQIVESSASEEFELARLPIKQILKRKWLNLNEGAADDELDTQLRRFMGGLAARVSPILMRRSLSGEHDLDEQYVIYAWLARVLIRSKEEKGANFPRFSRKLLSDDAIVQVARLSREAEGPKLARSFLGMLGICLVVEPPLKGMTVDGASMFDEEGTPVIGLTVRYDRIDSFWFTLMHELVHVQRHLNSPQQAFIDVEGEISELEAEREADRIAGELLIPRSIWNRSAALLHRTESAIVQLADEMRLHPAIIAGRIRREASNYRILTKMMGQGEIRKHFPMLSWES